MIGDEEIQEALRKNPERWIWCLHCEGVFQVKDVRVEYVRIPGIGKVQAFSCPNVWGPESWRPGPCNGDPLDWCWWDELLAGEHWGGAFVGRGYPEVPERGKRYPLYADEE